MVSNLSLGQGVPPCLGCLSMVLVRTASPIPQDLLQALHPIQVDTSQLRVFSIVGADLLLNKYYKNWTFFTSLLPAWTPRMCSFTKVF